MFHSDKSFEVDADVQLFKSSQMAKLSVALRSGYMRAQPEARKLILGAGVNKLLLDHLHHTRHAEKGKLGQGQIEQPTMTNDETLWLIMTEAGIDPWEAESWVG